MATTALFDIGTLIQSRPDYNGGRPCLAGTRLSVLQVAVLYKEGLTPDQILEEYPHLDLARIHAGIAYYLANRAAMDAELDAEAQAFNEGLGRQEAQRARASA